MASDEEMRKLLKPCPDDEQVLDILQQNFAPEGTSVKIIKALDSYDDCNYQVEIGTVQYLLKIHNGGELLTALLRLYG